MANRRMINRSVVDSDAFLDLPKSSQLAYFHIILRADDEGAFDSVKRLCREIQVKERDIEKLCEEGFLTRLRDNVVVVKDWSSHNVIKKDRFTKSKYHDEMKNQSAGNIEGIREKWNQNGTKAEPKRNQSGDILEPQVNIGKDSIGKVRDEMREYVSRKVEGTFTDRYAINDKLPGKVLNERIPIKEEGAIATDAHADKRAIADDCGITPPRILRVSMEELNAYADSGRKKSGGSGT